MKRVVEKFEADQSGNMPPPRVERHHNYDAVAELVAERVEKSQSRISAKRLLPTARTAGYTGFDRNFRRLVADAKVLWHSENHRGRPAVWAPGEYLAIDWAQAAPELFLFCAMLAFFRRRFVRFATDQRASTTLGLIAETLGANGGGRHGCWLIGLPPQGWGDRRRGDSHPGLRSVGQSLRVRPGFLAR